jgi:hypothetical protein
MLEPVDLEITRAEVAKEDFENMPRDQLIRAWLTVGTLFLANISN